MLKAWLLLTSIIHFSSAFHSFISEPYKRPVAIQTNYVPPSAERFFNPQIPSAITAKTIAAPIPAPFITPYAYQPQIPNYGIRQFPYYPTPFYPPQQYIYPTPLYVQQRYPSPAENGNEQGSSGGSSGGWGSYWPSWGSFGNFPSFPTNVFGGTPSESENPASAGPSSAAESIPQSVSSSGNKGKPEKVEATESPQDAGKSEAEKVELPEQQYILVGQPQFFGHFAAFPADRDPSLINNAGTKGAVSSFLFYRDQSEQQQSIPQKQAEVTSNVPNTASIAYQRFLLLSKQRSEDASKSPLKSETPNSLKETSQISSSNSTVVDIPSTQSPEENITQSVSSAVDCANVGGVASISRASSSSIGNIKLSSSASNATTIANTSSNATPELSKIPLKKVFSIATYDPQRGYHVQKLT